MADYERNTVLSTTRVLELTGQVLSDRAGLQPSRQDGHGATYTGPEGTVNVEAHRHGAMTAVTIRTNQLRTSKVDIVVRHLMNQLPYQPGDPEREY